MEAPPDLVWEVMTDPDLYADIAPNLSEVEIVEGEGEGMVRRCVDTDGKAWTEECHLWEPGRRFEVSVDVENSEFHRHLFSRFEGSWSLTEREDDVLVEIAFDYDTKYGPIGMLVSKYFEYKGPPIVESILDGWEEEVEERLDEAPSTTEQAYDQDGKVPNTLS